MADGRFRRKADISTALNPPGGSSALALESPPWSWNQDPVECGQM